MSLFNRGVTHPTLFPSVEKIRGFRSPDPAKENLSKLVGRSWDVVVDIWPQNPLMVESAARLLAPRTTHYLYVSSVAAYDGYPTPNMTEESPLRPWTPATSEYEPDKAESERRLLAIAGSKLTVVRPGPIKGERDGGPDVVSWLLRARSGGQHIGPGDGADPVQFVDVKDVAAFLNLAIEQNYRGAYNLTGASVPFRTFLAHCKEVTGSTADFVWIPKSFLDQHGLQSDHELGVYSGYFPFWRPEPVIANIFRISSSKAYRAGWMTRPFAQTAKDCLESFGALSVTPPTWKDYLSPGKEREALEAWSGQSLTMPKPS